MFFSTAPEPQPPSRWLAKTIGFLLIGTCLVAVMRASVASIVSMHGTGMSPTLVEGDRVLIVRGNWGIRRGDIVVYYPEEEANLQRQPSNTPLKKSPAKKTPPYTIPRDRSKKTDQVPSDPYRNAAIAELGELRQRWNSLAIASDSNAHRLRVGRIIAVPGDKVTFQVPDAAMGLAINGVLLRHAGLQHQRRNEQDGNRKKSHSDDSYDISASTERDRLSPSVYEWNGSTYYPILYEDTPVSWPGIQLPPEQWPIEMRASGYLILADNRKDGDCCDGRSFGWVNADRVRGEVSARIRSDLETPNEDRGWLSGQKFQWLP